LDFCFEVKKLSSTGSRTYRRRHSNKAGSRRRKKKTFHIDLFRLGVITATTVIFLGAGITIYNHLPSVKVDKAIAAGDRYTENADYEAAIDSYSEAIEIDSHSVTAYSNMAGAYLSIDDIEAAKKTLYAGWQNTDNEGLLDNYHAVIMNEAVACLNDGAADLDTLRSVVGILSENPESSDAVALLDSAYERLFDENFVFDYAGYKSFVKELLDIYKAAPSDELAGVIRKYSTPGEISFTISTEDAADYNALLKEIDSTVGASDSAASMMACFDNSVEVLGIFSGIFEQLDVGNVDELRGFVVSDEYITLRDIFLKGEETPQENTTYVPISREQMILNCNEGKWTYRFASFEEYPETAGVITLWANFFEDNGIQRNSISYEPASTEAGLYPHTKYSVTYLKSYITSGRSTRVEKMNYRLDTTISLSEDEEIQTIIGDWGGPDEWEMDIDTIESRIKP
jgi:tetratricopeptide (TPR) repeat protein